MFRRNRSATRTLALFGLVACLGIVRGSAPRWIGTFGLDPSGTPLISGSRAAVRVSGIALPYTLSVAGPGTLNGSTFAAPLVHTLQETFLIGAASGALAVTKMQIVPPPLPHRPLLAVATYDGGVALHDPRSYALIGYAGIGAPPGDVAFTRKGSLLATDTDGDTLARFERDPWKLRSVRGVSTGNEVGIDSRTGNVFVTDRDVGGKGAVTRIAPDGASARVFTGVTAEGLAIDSGRQLVYVGNVNDRAVAEIDARTMRISRLLPSVPRTFGIALDSQRRKLYVVSNASRTMQRGGGYVGTIDLAAARPRVTQRSPPMTFPLGIAFEARVGRLFVTDEGGDEVYVLDARTLRPLRAPLPTCAVPWRPRIFANRLYVPCARANAVDVFDLRTLRRIAGAPFHTGGFPLAVAEWP